MEPILQDAHGGRIKYIYNAILKRIWWQNVRET